MSTDKVVAAANASIAKLGDGPAQAKARGKQQVKINQAKSALADGQAKLAALTAKYKFVTFVISVAAFWHLSSLYSGQGERRDEKIRTKRKEKRKKRNRTRYQFMPSPANPTQHNLY